MNQSYHYKISNRLLLEKLTQIECLWQLQSHSNKGHRSFDEHGEISLWKTARFVRKSLYIIKLRHIYTSLYIYWSTNEIEAFWTKLADLRL